MNCVISVCLGTCPSRFFFFSKILGFALFLCMITLYVYVSDWAVCISVRVHTSKRLGVIDSDGKVAV